jgi:hypothetical protein
MYPIALALHSWLRWAALVAGVGATSAAFLDRAETTRQGRADAWGLGLMVLLDLQLLLGLLLYLILSPLTTAALRDPAQAMRNPSLRFFAVDHLVLMMGAVILAHLGRRLAQSAKTPAAKRTRLWVCFGLATLAMIAATPWPGTSRARPLFRL